jgi:hypothetical protein
MNGRAAQRLKKCNYRVSEERLFVGPSFKFQRGIRPTLLARRENRTTKDVSEVGSDQIENESETKVKMHQKFSFTCGSIVFLTPFRMIAMFFFKYNPNTKRLFIGQWASLTCNGFLYPFSFSP